MVAFKVTGVDAVRKQVEAIAKSAPYKIEGALYREAEAVMTDAKRNYVPVAERRGGTLRNTKSFLDL